jgi:hypothetical protein
MRAEDIQGLVRAQPFRPFRIHVSDGSHYDVRDPLFVLVWRLRVEIGLKPDEGGLPKKAVFVDPAHITRVTFLNGQRPRRRRRSGRGGGEGDSV